MPLNSRAKHSNRIWILCSSLILLALAAAVVWRLLPVTGDWAANRALQAENEALQAELQTIEKELDSAANSNQGYAAGLAELEARYAALADLPARTLALEQQYAADIRKLEDAILAGSSDAKIAYLTFDDGPYADTPQFLAILAEKKAPATFFLLGKEKYADTYRQEYAAGHTLANHTYSHQIRDGVYRSADAFMADVEKQSDFLETIVGVRPAIVRFPGGAATAGSQRQAITDRLAAAGYGYVDWDAVTGDGTDNSLTSAKALQNALKTVGDRSIAVLLMHDYSDATLGALADIIDGLRDRGYLLLPLYPGSTKLN